MLNSRVLLFKSLTNNYINKPFKTNKFYDFRNNKLNIRLYSTNDPYKILGVSPNASKDEIKKAFLKKAKKYHPDLSKDPNANKMFLKIKEAYDLIKEGNYVHPSQQSSHTYSNEWSQPQPEKGYSTSRRYQRRYTRRTRNVYNDPFRHYDYEYWDNKENEEVFKKHQEEIKKKISPIFTYIFIGSMIIIAMVSVFHVI